MFSKELQYLKLISTYFIRGCGFISLENLLFFARNYPVCLLFCCMAAVRNYIISFFFPSHFCSPLCMIFYSFSVAWIPKFVQKWVILDTNCINIQMKASFRRLLFKQDGNRATWEYPFAVAGINVSFMLIQMLDLFSGLLANSLVTDITFCCLTF